MSTRRLVSSILLLTASIWGFSCDRNRQGAAPGDDDWEKTFAAMPDGIEVTHVPDPAAPLEWYGAPPGCLAFRPEGSALVCALNTSDVPVPLPPGEVLLASGAPPKGAALTPGTAVWLV